MSPGSQRTGDYLGPDEQAGFIEKRGARPVTHSHMSRVHHITGEVFSPRASVFLFGSSLQDVFLDPRNLAVE